MDNTESLNPPCVLLIDLDNCPMQIAQLPQTITHFSRIIVCYGGFEPKIPLSQLTVLAPAIVAGRLTIAAMERKGKNAADFGLTFWAGRLVMEMPPLTEFLILSQDSDLDYLIDMLRAAGRKVKRVDGNSYLNLEMEGAIPDNSPNTLSLAAAAQDYYEVQISSRRARPARRLTLLNSIRSHFKSDLKIEPDAVLQELIRQGVLSIGRIGQIIYRDRITNANPPKSENNALSTEVVNLADNEIATIPKEAIKTLSDEYYVINIANQRTRPVRRAGLLNSISSHFKGQPAVDPNAIMDDLFQRGLISQNQRGILNYHKQATPLVENIPVPTEIINNAALEIKPPALEIVPPEIPLRDISDPDKSGTTTEEIVPVANEITLAEEVHPAPAKTKRSRGKKSDSAKTSAAGNNISRATGRKTSSGTNSTAPKKNVVGTRNPKSAPLEIGSEINPNGESQIPEKN